MKTSIGIVGVMLGVALVAPSTAHDGHDDVTEAVFRVDKDSHVKIGENLKAGTIVVKKGRYAMAHRVESGGHVTSLTSIDTKPGAEPTRYDVLTDVWPSRTPVTKTAIYAKELQDTTLQITVIQFAGENNDHMPQSGDRSGAASY